jgi:AraC-like DNA-binding protein
MESFASEIQLSDSSPALAAGSGLADRLLPICDALTDLVDTGALAEGRQYFFPLRGRSDGITLTLSVPERKPPSDTRANGLQPRQLRRVLDYIRSNIADTISLSELAAVARLSSSYFSRAFKVSVGETPHAHVLRLRVEAAMAMMLDGNEPLAQIAIACGLADQSHLTKRFRNLVGITPSRWRRVNRR